MDISTDIMAAVTSIVGVLQAANFFYMKGLAGKIDKLSNGCFARHMELAKKEGQVEMTVKAMHDRLDRIEEQKDSQ